MAAAAVSSCIWGVVLHEAGLVCENALSAAAILHVGMRSNICKTHKHAAAAHISLVKIEAVLFGKAQVENVTLESVCNAVPPHASSANPDGMQQDHHRLLHCLLFCGCVTCSVNWRSLAVLLSSSAIMEGAVRLHSDALCKVAIDLKPPQNLLQTRSDHSFWHRWQFAHCHCTGGLLLPHAAASGYSQEPGCRLITCAIARLISFTVRPAACPSLAWSTVGCGDVISWACAWHSSLGMHVRVTLPAAIPGCLWQIASLLSTSQVAASTSSAGHVFCIQRLACASAYAWLRASRTACDKLLVSCKPI